MTFTLTLVPTITLIMESRAGLQSKGVVEWLTTTGGGTPPGPAFPLDPLTPPPL